MKPPTLQQVKDYVVEKGYSVDPDVFFEFFDVGGWVDSRGNKVQNWKQKLITWNSFGNGGSRKSKKTKLFPIPGKNCSHRGCRMLAVYKNSEGAYDSYSCLAHSPKEVQEAYCI